MFCSVCLLRIFNISRYCVEWETSESKESFLWQHSEIAAWLQGIQVIKFFFYPSHHCVSIEQIWVPKRTLHWACNQQLCWCFSREAPDIAVVTCTLVYVKSEKSLPYLMLLLPGAVRLLGGMCNLEMRNKVTDCARSLWPFFFLKPALCLSILPEISCVSFLPLLYFLALCWSKWCHEGLWQVAFKNAKVLTCLNIVNLVFLIYSRLLYTSNLIVYNLCKNVMLGLNTAALMH